MFHKCCQNMAKGKKDKKKDEEQPALFDLALFTVTPEEQDLQQNEFNYKVDDAIFWGVMVASYGIFNRAVKIFKRDYDITISRQAVGVRANKHPKRLDECRELILDAAEEIGMNLLLNGDKRTQLEAYKHMTSKLGKRRGYGDTIDVNNTGEVTIKSVTVKHISTGVPLATSEKEIDQTKTQPE